MSNLFFRYLCLKPRDAGFLILFLNWFKMVLSKAETIDIYLTRKLKAETIDLYLTRMLKAETIDIYLTRMLIVHPFPVRK